MKKASYVRKFRYFKYLDIPFRRYFYYFSTRSKFDFRPYFQCEAWCKRGYKAALGVFTGDALLIFLAFLGVASLVKTSPVFFIVIKYAGALYLTYLGLKTLYATFQKKKETSEQVSEVTVKAKEGLYVKALFLSMLNPKMIIFYVSFFIQFIDPKYENAGVPFFVLGAILETCSMIYLSILIFGGVAITNKVKHNKRLASLSNSCIGAVFLLFGAKLALTA